MVPGPGLVPLRQQETEMSGRVTPGPVGWLFTAGWAGCLGGALGTELMHALYKVLIFR